MTKYSSEFKLKVVKYCVEDHHSMCSAARKFGIPSSTPLKEWIRKYKEHGSEGLIKRQKSSYSGEFKQYVVEYMHNNHLSCLKTSIQFNLGNTDIVNKWERIYYEEGPQALYEERRGRPRKMSSKPKRKKLDKKVEEDLIAEVQHLRMENEYLKKLNALVQERIKRENKKK